MPSKVKRLRIFAGPNGSGKSTFIDRVRNNPPEPGFKLGHYVNADEIEKMLFATRLLSFDNFGITVTQTQLRAYLRRSKFAPVKLKNPELWKSFYCSANVLSLAKELEINSYIAADLAEFIRRQLLKSGQTFSYETVMSDKKKIAFLSKARKAGYKVYLYYFATEDPRININRVKVRVALKGHKVKDDVIKKRYYKSLENMRAAVKLSDRAYLFDNSAEASVLVAEITGGKKGVYTDRQNVPVWVTKYLKPKPVKRATI